jgi:GDP-L-fucose synthase
MKILITGGSGFIGRNLVEYLGSRHELLVPARSELNLVDEESVNSFFRRHKVDVVIHTAGKPGHRNTSDSSGILYADTRMYFSLMHNRERFDKLLITGSGAVYDIRNYRPKMKEEEWKDHIPEDEHGFFRYVTAHHIEASPGVVDLRLFGIFGKYEDYAIRFISNAICKTLFDMPITIKQNRIFDYLYINDLFPIIEFFVNNDVRYHEYNVTPDKAVSLRCLAERILAVAGKDLPILIAQEGMGLEYSGDNSRLRQELPNFTFTAIDDAIAQLYKWYRHNKSQIKREVLLIDK